MNALTIPIMAPVKDDFRAYLERSLRDPFVINLEGLSLREVIRACVKAKTRLHPNYGASIGGLVHNLDNYYLHQLMKDIGLNDTVRIEERVDGKLVSENIPKWRLITSHTARRTAITVNVLRGHNIHGLKRCSGHTDLRVFDNYVRDDTGNRRFWIVPVGVTKPSKDIFDGGLEGERDQVWAEASKWDHLDLRVSRVIGTPRQRTAALETEADVYVVGRDSLVWLVDYYHGDPPFDCLVLDELTSFKSHSSARFKAVRSISPLFHRVIGLTGTPSPNGLADLWAQIYCLDLGERLGKSVTRFRSEYFSLHKWNNIVVRMTPLPGARETIERKLSDICLSMQAKDYLTLPDLIVHDVPVELDAATLKKYDEFQREEVMTFQGDHRGEPVNVIAQSAAGLMNKLQQFTSGAVYDDGKVAHIVHGEKLRALAEIVESAQSPVLVFYSFISDIDRIREALKFTGLTVRKYEDDHDLQDWNAGKIDVLLAHPASTAYGLNLQQGGHYIVWFGLTWNLELYLQANARLHRQGQRKPVQVYRLLCPGTVDEKVAAALERKEGVQESLLRALKEMLSEYVKA